MFMETFPDEIDLLAFFEGEPTFQDREYLHFAYQYTDQNEMSILFSRSEERRVGKECRFRWTTYH